MFPRIPWRPVHAIVWDSLQSLLFPLIPRPFLPAPRVGVPVYIMLPLDAALPNAHMPLDLLQKHLKRLKDIGVTGVMMDIWWAVCEPLPGKYDFDRYVQLIDICKQARLQVQATMSFHSCGGNVGDSVNIPLPTWVLEAGEEHDLWFTDDKGLITREYITFGADEEQVLPAAVSPELHVSPDQRSIPQEIVEEAVAASLAETTPASNGMLTRTPVQAYMSFITAFLKRMTEAHLIDTIAELQIGLGPCGELRYPSYQLVDGRWLFPGIGKFQCFDKYLLSSLKAAVASSDRDEVKNAELPPTNAGECNDTPWQTRFFTKDYKTKAGRWFLQWYFKELLDHGERILKGVRGIAPDMIMAVKISGVHWWRFSPSRAAEATVGYMNGRSSGYDALAKLFKRYGAVFDFTCLEMRTLDQPFLKARCGPRQLVNEVFRTAARNGVHVAGENALERLDWPAFQQIISAYQRTSAKSYGFTLLRLNERMMEEENLNTVARFVAEMSKL